MEGRKLENPACELQGICQRGWKRSNSSTAALETHLNMRSERTGNGQGAAVEVSASSGRGSDLPAVPQVSEASVPERGAGNTPGMTWRGDKVAETDFREVLLNLLALVVGNYSGGWGGLGMMACW